MYVGGWVLDWSQKIKDILDQENKWKNTFNIIPPSKNKKKKSFLNDNILPFSIYNSILLPTHLFITVVSIILYFHLFSEKAVFQSYKSKILEKKIMWLKCILIKPSLSNKTYIQSILYWRASEYKSDMKSVRSAENWSTLGHDNTKSK